MIFLDLQFNPKTNKPNFIGLIVLKNSDIIIIKKIPVPLRDGGYQQQGFFKTATAYKYNGGCAFENAGSLDYYNTFYRKYDAQIGSLRGWIRE